MVVSLQDVGASNHRTSDSRLRLLIVIFLFAVVFWGVFYSKHLSNYSFTYSARKSYQEIYWKMLSLTNQRSRPFPPFNPIYTFLISDKETNGSYIYLFLGKFDRVEVETKTIYLIGFDQVIYPFRISETQLVHWTVIPNSLEITPSGALYDDVHQKLFSQDTVIQVQWSDQRVLTRILADYSNNSRKPLNLEGTTRFLTY